MIGRRTFCVAIVLCALGTGCSAKGSSHLSCSSTEVSPSEQPGKPTPRAALNWYLGHGESDLPTSGFTLASHVGNRYVFRNGDTQLSVISLPHDRGKPQNWVVTLIYDCS